MQPNKNTTKVTTVISVKQSIKLTKDQVYFSVRKDTDTTDIWRLN